MRERTLRQPSTVPQLVTVQMSPSLEGIMFNRNANLSSRRPLLAEPQKPLVVPPRAPPRDTGPHRPVPTPRNLPNPYEYRPDYWKPSNVELERRLQETRAREKVGYFQDKVTTVTPELSLDRREAELVFRFDPHASAEYLSTQYRAPTVHYAKPPTPVNGFSNRLPERDGPFVFGVHSPSQFPIPRRDDDDYDYSEVAEDNGRTVMRDDDSEGTNCCDKVNEWTVRDKKSRRTLNRMFQIKDRRKVKGGKKEKIKCVLVGDGAVGKSSLIAAYAQDTFREEYQPTAYDTFNGKKNYLTSLWNFNQTNVQEPQEFLNLITNDPDLLRYKIIKRLHHTSIACYDVLVLISKLFSLSCLSGDRATNLIPTTLIIIKR